MASKSDSDTYWILDPRELEALVLPIRLEIIDRLAALGPTRARDLARALGRRQTALYHHLAKLEEAGLIRRTERLRNGGRPAQHYETVAPRMRLSRAAADPKLKDYIVRAAHFSARQSARDYEQGFAVEGRRLEGPGRDHWWARVYVPATSERMARINALLDQIFEVAMAPEPQPSDAPLISLAWFMSPLPARNASDEADEV